MTDNKIFKPITCYTGLSEFEFDLKRCDIKIAGYPKLAFAALETVCCQNTCRHLLQITRSIENISVVIIDRCYTALRCSIVVDLTFYQKAFTHQIEIIP